MKTQKTLYALFCMGIFMATLANFTACGNNTAGSTAAAPAGTCAAGQVNTQYGCLATTSCGGAQTGYGYYPTTNSCYPPVATTSLAGYGQVGQWTGALTSINQSVFAQLLQAAGACNQYNIVNWGGSNCKAYTPAGYIMLVYSGASTVTVQIMAGTSNPAYIGLMNVAAGGGAYGGYGNGTITISRTLTINPVGNGVHMIDTYGSGLSITDTNESFNSINMNLVVQYAGQTLANALALK